ncbi:MAG TPA: hypothetical protein VHF22_15595, partial [Planctomycetota bacterium]|nr:hypothetical protein [Planctomycetota bacterium]
MPSLGILLGTAILRIAVDAPGVYEVPADALKSAGLDARHVALVGGATETALPVFATETGSLLFAAAPRTRHSRRTTFVLREPREGEAASRADANLAEPVPGYFRCERNDVYDPLPTEDRTALDPFGYGG